MRLVLFSLLAFSLAGCAGGSANTASPNALNSGDQAKQAFLISDTADAFGDVSAGDAKDCASYATFIGLRPLGPFSQQSAEEAEFSKNSTLVWREVFSRKSEAEQAETHENREARVKARQNGTLDKLSAEKCILPVVAEMKRVS